MLAWREVKVRYKQSVMGLLWAVLMPLVIVGAGLIVRLAFTHASGTPLARLDLVSVAVKAVPWAFFVSALRFGTNSLVTNANLLTKIYLPRLIFPLAATLAQLVDFVVAAAVIAIFLFIMRTGLSVHLLWVPLLAGVLIAMAASLAIILSAASLFFRDVKYLVEVLLTFAIFFTPVFYDSSLFGPWAAVLLLNPVSPILEGLAATVVGHREPSLLWLSYSLTVTALLVVIAVALFRKVEPFFAESV
jgi:ABC-type polysaccharide/polyol phosphate export permease